MNKKIIFTSTCNRCNKNNEITVSKKQSKKITPRYCTECGNKTDYSKKPCSL